MPIRHPISGKAVGAVNLTCWRKDAGRLLIALAWLYRENDIHAAIVSLRTASPQATPGVPAGQRKSMESLREQLDAARTEITRLKSDNTAMRNQLARQLGIERTNGHFSPA